MNRERLSTVLTRLDSNNKYWYRETEWSSFYEELWAAIDEFGIVKVKKFLRENGCIVPYFLKNQVTGKHLIRRNCVFVVINNEHCLYDKHMLRYLYSHRLGRYVVYTTAEYAENRYEYDGVHYPISIWVEFGRECEDCGAPFITRHHETYCISCMSANEPYSYNTAVETVLGFEQTNERLYGIELEYEDVTARDVIKSLKNYALPKRDGSIRNGVEVVTQPACIHTHKQKLKAFYDAVAVRAASSTGMHVHVDRKRLSQIQIGAMIEFMNSRDNATYLIQIAKRDFTNNHYCRSDNGLKATSGIYFDEDELKYYRNGFGRYTPLNLDKKGTIEFRIFSSPESYDEMCAKLTFVDALVDFTNPYINNFTLKQRTRWEHFKKFVLDNLKKYSDLVTYYPEVFA